MTKIIINPRQLRAINEAAIDNTHTFDSSKGENISTALENVPTNITEPIAVVDTNPNKINNGTSTFLGGVENAKKEQTKPSTRTTLVMPGQLEESRFSKRQVELGRMLEMRRTGKVFSKKQLNEMFMETQENADELRSIFQNGGGRNLAFKVAEIIDDVFPEESYGSELLDAVLGGADPAEFIIQNIFSDFADKEEEREVLDRIRELTTKRGF